MYWNLVEGMFEGECVVWVDGEPHHVGRLPFDGLDGVGELRFTPLAARTHHENYLVLASDYEQPFGTFSGSLPIAGEIARARRDGTPRRPVVILVAAVALVAAIGAAIIGGVPRRSWRSSARRC